MLLRYCISNHGVPKYRYSTFSHIPLRDHRRRADSGLTPSPSTLRLVPLDRRGCGNLSAPLADRHAPARPARRPVVHGLTPWRCGRDRPPACPKRHRDAPHREVLRDRHRDFAHSDDAAKDAAPIADLAWICGEGGEPLVKESFGNMFAETARRRHQEIRAWRSEDRGDYRGEQPRHPSPSLKLFSAGKVGVKITAIPSQDPKVRATDEKA